MNKPIDYEKPVAYDTQGRPLYYRAETTMSSDNESPQKVHVVKDANPEPVEVSEEVRIKHRESKQKYPHLNLSEEEYVINAVKRHPLGVISIWLSVIGVCVVIMLVPATYKVGFIGLSSQGVFFGIAIIVALIILAVLIGAVATMVYQANKFYLTNESVIQHIQNSLLSQNDQIVSLGNIEDASYTQRGVFQMIFGYGSIRLSTQGDETTYRFHWVTNPKKQIDLLNNAIEAFKHGRPVEG